MRSAPLNITQEVQAELIAAALEKADRLRVTLTGPSMAPTIRSGDAVEILPPGQMQVGEIYLFKSREGRIYAHRFLRSEVVQGVRRFIFKGDHLTLSDSSVPRENILGVISGVWHRHEVFAFRFHGIVAAWFHLLRPWARVLLGKISISLPL